MTSLGTYVWWQAARYYPYPVKKYATTKGCQGPAYGLLLCLRSLRNISKNARELGVGCRQFYARVNGLRSIIQLTNMYFIISLHLSNTLKSEAI